MCKSPSNIPGVKLPAPLPFWFVFALVLVINPNKSQGGIHVPGEPPLLPPNPTFSQVRLVLSEIRGLAIAEQPGVDLKSQSGLYPFYSNLRKSLEEKTQQGKATLDEEIQLGGCLLRLNQPTKAMGILESALKKAPDEFPSKHLLLSNLASAYGANDLFLDRAVDTQRLALKSWPTPGEDFNKWERGFRAEVFFLKLLQEKQLRKNSRETPLDAPPGIFGDYSQEWKRSPFQPGKSSLYFYERMPTDALENCSTLLSWLPLDNQVYWLYGEILNTRGDSESAFKILDELVNARQMSNSQTLFEHSRILRRANSDNQQSKKDLTGDKKTIENPISKENGEKQRSLLGGDIRFFIVGLFAGGFVCILLQKQLKQWFSKR